MLTSNNKVQRTVKTKFRKDKNDTPTNNDRKAKHHDKTYYRLLKQERMDYGV